MKQTAGAIPKLGTKEFNNLAMEMFGGKPKQQTAVEWVFQELDNYYQMKSKFKSKKEILKQAKEMEKQQGYSGEEVKNIMAETWIQCVGNDGNNFKEVRDKILNN